MGEILSENCSSAKFTHFDPLIREIKFRENFFLLGKTCFKERHIINKSDV